MGTKKYLLTFWLSLFFVFSPFVINELEAQCPMCRIGAESNLKNGGTAGRGLNKGILYLFAAPYLLIGGLAYVWYKNRRLESEED